MPSCDLKSLTKSAACGKSYSPAGVQDRIYVFNIASFNGNVPSPDDATGFYSATDFANIEFFPIDIKRDSGQVTSSKSEDDESRTLEAQAVINYSLDKFLPIDAAMAFMNVGVIVPIDNTNAYVVMSPYRRTRYSSDFDSGTTYDSDHGFTIKFTASPVLFGCPMIALSGLNLTSGGSVNSKVTAVTMNNGNTPTVNVDSSITLGATTTPAGGTITWSSSDTSKATVDQTGKVTGIAAGVVTIYASCNGKSATHTVTVQAS